MEFKIVEEPTESEAVFWKRLHEIVQDRLEKLIADVKQIRPGVKTQVMFSPARFIPFGSYLTFRDSEDSNVESIIVEVVYRQVGGVFCTSGGILGEESGRSFYDTATQEISRERKTEIEQSLCHLAEDLQGHHLEVLQGLDATQ